MQRLVIVMLFVAGCRHAPMVSSSPDGVQWQSTEVVAAAICGLEEHLNVQGETGERDDRKSFELDATFRDGAIASSHFYVVRSWLRVPMVGKITRLDVTLRATDAGRVLSGTLQTGFEPLAQTHLEVTTGLGFHPASIVFTDVPVQCVPELPPSLASRHSTLLGP